MATGIVSLDAAAEGLGGLSLALLAIGLAVYVALAARALAHPAEVPAELGDPVRALSALAIVAGTGVLAARIARAPVDVLALAVGGGASVGIAAARRGDADLAGDQWIFMGALAIATVAACRIDAAWPDAAISGASVVLWVLASIWVPFLLALEAAPVRRRALRRYRWERFATGPSRGTPIVRSGSASRTLMTRLRVAVETTPGAHAHGSPAARCPSAGEAALTHDLFEDRADDGLDQPCQRVPDLPRPQMPPGDDPRRDPGRRRRGTELDKAGVDLRDDLLHLRAGRVEARPRVAGPVAELERERIGLGLRAVAEVAAVDVVVDGPRRGV